MCSDPFWGVRKSCAEVIHPLAQACSKESRWNVLSPCLIQLLQDQSRWVKTAALRVLGYFISTFARSNDQDDEQDETQSSSTKANDEQSDDLSLKTEQKSQIEETDHFSDFNYWREAPLINIDLDEETIDDSNQCD